MLTKKTIPLVEPQFLPSYADAVRDQIISGFVGPGPRTQQFTKSLTDFVGASYGLLTVSGTIALSVAAHAIGLKPGDEILVPAYGVISTINGFASVGLCPKLVDIDQTGCMSADRLKQAISKKTKAVCFVDFSGYTGSNLTAIKSICDANGLPLIEDAACALGHTYQGTHAGLFGTVGIYSFSVPKVLSTGQGGALVTSNKEFFEKAAAYIDQGDLEWRKTNLNKAVGSNLRFNDVLSALGLCQLIDLKDRLFKRYKIFQDFKNQLEDYIFSIPGEQAPLHNIVFANQPDLLIEKLKLQGISATRQYRTISTHPAYQSLDDQVYPYANFWTQHAVYLPFGMKLTSEDALYIAQAIKNSGIELISCEKRFSI